MKYQKHCPGCFKRKDGEAICPACGYDESQARSPLFLPHGTLLAGQYRVGRVLGSPGGFGITYLGWDVNLQQRVAIKEFLPPEIAARVPLALGITVHTQDNRKAFDVGREQFLREARIVAALDHPNIVRVRSFFNANDTAYLVMDYYEGLSLDGYFHAVRPVLDAPLAIALFRPIIDGLRYVHEKGVLHRDIKPQNIYLAAVGRPILLDFGAARQALGSGQRSLSVVLTEGYAPLEQYQRKGGQGPWTDIYGVAASLFRTIGGQAPPLPLDRLVEDGLASLEHSLWGQIPRALRPALQKALALKPEQRLSSVDALLAELDAFLDEIHSPVTDAQTVTTAAAAAAPSPTVAPGEGPTLQDTPPPRPAAPAAAVTAVTAPVTAPPATRPAGLLRSPLLWAAALLLAGLAFLLLRPPEPYTPPLRAEAVAPAAGSRRPPLSPSERQLLPQWAPLAGGTVEIGSSSGRANERPPAVVTLAPLAVSRHEVTVGQFRLFVAHSGYRNPAWAQYPCAGAGRSGSWEAPGYAQDDNSPVVCVSAADAQAFAEWLAGQTGRSVRLPTEAEWEYAARAGSRSAYWWGESFLAGHAECAGCPPRLPTQPAPVGRFPASPFGLYDTAGNVREWTCSRYAALSAGEAQRCASPLDETTNLVVRGGSWQEDVMALRSSQRDPFSAYSRNVWTGFRLVQAASP
ncbi:MAG TPA: SUMF1/EgtB/PvdO family nonheme iron enzyme [Nevskiaceae bacterium]|nr:SUMF1/EgtB/PvdO family nonheme iron enzyme [Nevskiaceae bacterium]